MYHPRTWPTIDLTFWHDPVLVLGSYYICPPISEPFIVIEACYSFVSLHWTTEEKSRVPPWDVAVEKSEGISDAEIIIGPFFLEGPAKVPSAIHRLNNLVMSVNGYRYTQ